ncbi:hypothetical protein MPTK1_8g05340 [Marchantia polymorpha subsp. ruderalis]|uniref:Uncharacterized protein n=1 Tax=Marchantia polymorpha TaxID=3197 RepID=A0A2R6WKC4_MARPO|nr:hypothetical protein MARPO_0081s0035 [Marchantia polymorpha]BBN18769.1 hypothetical protein Mp_8g05340 [Marchantia polymorpha subsp. ruderalis]|eukprot:PTQ34308.1 hypothetical protein MARPO_0081s0035 [Marchantia polymorpha]
MTNAMLLPIVLTLLLSAFTSLQLVSAVDIVFWSGSTCDGVGAGCVNIAAGRCCRYDPNRPSVEFKYSASCKGVKAYGGTNSGCGTQIGSASGSGCFTGGYFSGGKWVNNSCRRRQLLTSKVAGIESEQCIGSSAQCTGYVKPNALFYREPSTEGLWILNKKNATGLFEQLASLPAPARRAWLKSHGASHQSETEQMKIFTVEN